MAEPKKTSVLILSRQCPYDGTLAQSAVDFSLAAAAFEQPVSLLLMGNGVLQLLNGQDTQGSSQKNIGKRLSSLPLYGIEKVYVDATSMARYDLQAEDLLLPVEILSDASLTALFSDHDHVVSF